MSKILRISDIETKDLLFFDAELKEKCFKFCVQRDIEFLPALEDATQIYVRDDAVQDFKVESISEPRKINGFQRAFDLQVLNAFRQNHLLFVFTGGELSGVVHFSDFNKSIVSTYLFEVFFQYEKTLRIFLQECRLGNSDIVTFFENKVSQAKKDSSRDFYQGRIDGYLKNKTEIDKLPPFQSFYLDDLISFANVHGNNLSIDVIELRNMIMHAHELVNMENWSADNFIFDFVSFEKFFRHAIALQNDYKRLKNKVAFLQGFDETVSFE
jgi:hypothetical protein